MELCYDIVVDDYNNSSEMPATLLADDTDTAPQTADLIDVVPAVKQFIYEFDDSDILRVKCETTASHKQQQKTTVKGRNGFQWHTQPTMSSNSDTVLPEQLLSQIPNSAQATSSPFDAWRLLIDDELLSCLVMHTNEEIRRRKSKVPEKRCTDLIEMRAWLGLNYLCGIFRNSPNNGPFDELWSLELGFAIFRATMTQKRFEYLADCIRFGDKMETKKHPLDAVHNFWQAFLKNCSAQYLPSGYCIIDEYSLQTSNESIQRAESEQNIHMLRLYDAKTLYLMNAVISKDNATLDSEVYTLLADPNYLCIASPARYTSVSLAQELFTKGISTVGALSTQAKAIPQECLSFAAPYELYAEPLTLLTGLDTDISPSGFLLASGISERIDAKKLYACTMRASQNFQRAADSYSTVFATPTKANRLIVDSLHALLDYTALNAWVLYRLSNPQMADITQREFQRQLGLDLTQQHMKRSMQSTNVEVSRRLQICDVLGKPTEKLLSALTKNATSVDAINAVSVAHQENPDFFLLMGKKLLTHRRCRKCKGANTPKTTMRCQQCLRPLCHRHFVLRCSTCTGIKEGDN